VEESAAPGESEKWISSISTRFVDGFKDRLRSTLDPGSLTAGQLLNSMDGDCLAHCTDKTEDKQDRELVAVLAEARWLVDDECLLSRLR
jgi:hypothetical protein